MIFPTNGYEISGADAIENLHDMLAFAGKQESAGSVALDSNGSDPTSAGLTIVYSVDGIPKTPSCFNSIGTRFESDL